MKPIFARARSSCFVWLWEGCIVNCPFFSLPFRFHIGAVQRLYAGVQCNSCGTRFLLDNEVKAEKYREHLDWHFRQNKLKKDDTKVSKCRKWYYGVSVSFIL